jgi:hypothetical protein
MSANKNCKLLCLNAHLARLSSEHTLLFNLIALGVAVLIFGLCLLIEWIIR